MITIKLNKENNPTPDNPNFMDWVILAAGIVCLLVLLLSTGCRSIKYVPVEKTHTEYVHTIDSVFKVDSIYHEKETVVMQVDSQAMAAFGVQLKATERAWLIKTKELEKKLDQLKELKIDTLIVRDTIPQIQVVEKQLTKWQRMKMNAGGWAIFLCIVSIVFIILGFIFRKKT